MVNLTKNGHHQTSEEIVCANVYGLHHYIFLAAFHIFLSFAASLGNVLILIALHKESSLHPPSKLLFRCLAVTDLGVGLIIEPMFAAELMLEIHKLRQFCKYFRIGGNIAGLVFSGVSLMTVTAISVDRILALSLGLRYRQVVTRRRVGAIASCFWLVCVAVSPLERFLSYSIFSKVISAVIILCLTTSVYCYTKIFHRLRHLQVQMQNHAHQGQPNGGGIPLNIARYRKTVSAALWVQITLVACYLPEGLLRPLSTPFSINEVTLSLARRYAVSLVYFNSSLNPFLYCWKNRAVRQAVKDTVNQYCCMTS